MSKLPRGRLGGKRNTVAERFYVNGPLQPGPVEVGGAEAHHLAAVCRLRSGDHVVRFKGDGRQYPAKVAAVGKRCVTLTVLGVEAPARELASAWRWPPRCPGATAPSSSWRS
jgi:16S rRNA U1498 N3-methylase RsmE